MSEIRPGFSWASLLSVLMGIGIIAFLSWSAVNKPQSIDNYAKGASSYTTSVTSTNHAYPLSCARFDLRPDGTVVDLDRKGKK